MPFCEKKNQKTMSLVFLVITLLIAVTRCIGLTYNMEIHPDENKFFLSTNSLLQSLMDPDVEFKEAKEYPEGAYLFQLPFQALGAGIAALTGGSHDLQLWGRISSLFYFALAGLLGMLILHQYLGRSRASVVLYGLTLCFSLFFIEHSRYGVGDMISLFLMLLILYLTAKSCTSGRSHVFLLLAFAAVGAMGSVKYPQVLFGLIPLSVFCFDRKRLDAKVWKRRLVLYGAVAFVTFLLFSPKAMFDWAYFYRVIRRESDAYLISGTAFEAGGLLNHIAGMAVYSLLYSDFPLALALLAVCFFKGFRRARQLLRSDPEVQENRLQFLFTCAVPGMCVFFFTYNLFPSLLVFRTYTPFFGISALYCAYYAGEIMKKGRWQRTVVLALTAIMVVRGAVLMGVTADPKAAREEFGAQVYEATDENWNTTVLMGQYIVPFDKENLVDPVNVSLSKWQDHNGGMELKPGTLLVTDAYAFALAEPYLLPGDTADAGTIARWQEFQEVNEQYFVCQSYPDCFYYLFGGWLRGGTLSTSLIPCNYVYYCP